MEADRGALKLACGFACTVIMLLIESVELQPAEEVVVRVMVYCPGFAKQCVGFCVTADPSLKSHTQLVMVPDPESVVRFVNVTQTGAHPESTFALNPTLGRGRTVMVTESIAAGEQPSVTVTV
jgi:hypothetical protein